MCDRTAQGPPESYTGAIHRARATDVRQASSRAMKKKPAKTSRKPAAGQTAPKRSPEPTPADTAAAAIGLFDWARRFLPEYFTDEPCAFHIELLRDLARPDLRLMVRIAPRGHAKSTCASLGLPLWAICERRNRNVVLVSHEIGLATQFGRDIRAELESNEAILEHYGDLTQRDPSNALTGDAAGKTPARAARRRSRTKWSEAMFTSASGVTVHAKGAGSAFRGLRVGPNRPDLIICDDIEKDDLVRSPEARRKLDQWLRRVVMPALAPGGRLIVVGSLLHFDSLLANLCRPEKFPRCDARVYRAIEMEPITEPGESALSQRRFREVALWPARWSLERLKEERMRIGTMAFEQEYQANPVDTDRPVFRAEWLHRCTHAEIDALIEGGQFVPLIMVDPATGEKKDKGDYFAMWIGGVDTLSGRILTREIMLDRIGFQEQVRRIIAAFRQHRPVKVGVESVAYQVALCQVLEEDSRRSGLYIPIVRVSTKKDKTLRIESSACFFENGTFRLPADLPADIEDQFLHFPRAGHDDAPDVCAMAIDLARDMRGGGGEALVSHSGESEQWRSGW